DVGVARGLVLVALLVAAPRLARAEPGSIVVVGTSSAPAPLERLAAAGTWTSVAEMSLLAAQPSLPDSGGFTRADPEKLSIRGGSVRWTRWSLDGFELSDPLFPGAAAIRVPWRFLDGLALTHREDPRHARDDAIALASRATTSTLTMSETGAAIRFTFPDAGGIFPGARGLTRTFSTTHPTDRVPAPPDERRRFLDHLNLSLGHTSRAPDGGALTYAIELDQATRRFLGFTSDPSDVTPLDEHVLGISGALGYSPRGDSGPYYLAAAEYSRRDRLFAELRYDADETARADRGVVLAGVRAGVLRAAATLEWLELEARNRSFTRELRDPDGEAFSPWYPSGTALAARVELGVDHPSFYVASLQQLVAFTPSVEAWSHAITLDGAPLGRIDLASAPTLQLSGDERAGARGHTTAGAFGVAWDLFVSTTFALNSSGVNTLLLPDAGGKLALTLPRPGKVEPFLALAKTPIAIDQDLVRKLDPRWLDGRRSTEDGDVYDHIGGANIDVAPGLRAPSVYSAGAGFTSTPWRGGRFELQGLLRAYAHPYHLEFAAHPSDVGYLADDGRYYLSRGEHRYVLRNRPLSETPFYAGLELAVRHEVPGSLVLWAGFATYTTVGRTPLGNGSTANDLGVVDESTASPNGDVNALASVDGDRAFALRALAAYRIVDGLWLTATARHKDGRPFAFVDVTTRDGQAAQTLASRRGSPLKWSRPLAGPREDFHLTIDVELQYSVALPGLGVTASVLATNLFDLGNELGERQAPLDARKNRAALELQTPRSLVLGLDVGF
ncbi:hypothetical protein L6R52_27295, partial [Myxococcota bacterium]|nr:hypothetical protein [Myxococcota bacterium]